MIEISAEEGGTVSTSINFNTIILQPIGKALTKFIKTRNVFDKSAKTGIDLTRILFDTNSKP